MRFITLAAAIAALQGLLAASARASTTLPPTDIPEPASLAVIAAGIAGLAIARYRRRK